MGVFIQLAPFVYSIALAFGQLVIPVVEGNINSLEFYFLTKAIEQEKLFALVRKLFLYCSGHEKMSIVYNRQINSFFFVS